MSFRFRADDGLIIVRVDLAGLSADSLSLRLALDTGATRTLINTALLIAAGYDPAVVPERVEITTGSGVEFAPLLLVRGLRALGTSRDAFPVLAHTLPPSAHIDGVLGLDFLRDKVLTLDFQKGTIQLCD